MNRIQKELAARKDLAPAGVWASPMAAGESAYSSPRAVLLDGEIDERAMSAAFVVCDSSLDDDGDIVEPQGCLEDLDRYRANPLVLWHHDRDSPGIGMSEDKAKALHVSVTKSRITATCFFHGKPFGGCNRSQEIFDLVVKGALRGASVGFIPLESEKRGHRKEDGYRFTRWLWTEWSVTPIPSNRETLRMCLSRGYVKSLDLKTTLEKWCGPRTEWANGVDLAAGGQSRDAMARKRKPVVVAVEFDRDVFKTLDAAKAWGKVHGRDISIAEELAATFVLKQHDAPATAGQQSLGKGVVGLLGFVKKAYEEDEDEDGKKKKKPMDEEAVEKKDKENDDDDSGADGDGDGAGDGGDDKVSSEDDSSDDESDLGDEDEGETDGEATEGDTDPEQMKAVLMTVKNVIAHCKGYIDAHPELKADGTPPSLAALYDKLLSVLDQAQQRIKKETVKLYGGNILDVMDDAPEAEEVDETTGADATMPVADEETPPEPEDEQKTLAERLKSLYDKTNNIAKAVA